MTPTHKLTTLLAALTLATTPAPTAHADTPTPPPPPWPPPATTSTPAPAPPNSPAASTASKTAATATSTSPKSAAPTKTGPSTTPPSAPAPTPPLHHPATRRRTPRHPRRPRIPPPHRHRHHPWHRWIRSRLTIDIVVRANPDGSELNWRYNHDPHADPEYGHKGKGYDPNRYHDPALHPDDNPVPESAAVQRTYAQADPDIVVDYHMQGRYTDAHGREITASVMWPTHPDVDTRTTDLARQVSVAAAQAMNASHPTANVSTYPGGNYQGIARNAYGLRGSGSVLIELSAIGPHAQQRQIHSAIAAMTAIAQRSADGSLTRIDPARADDIPPRGAPIPSNDRALTAGPADTLD
ncbi:M14 family metallopeptidase [Nocardiopsis gilva]|uniref:peptidase M14 n=1 Tax=Nocardiopsis gilva TaxID=280236 RepID=UPI001E2BB4EE|nr:peptidase M14 [Nocardiopsis gilva]